jgi:hypothetical protein
MRKLLFAAAAVAALTAPAFAQDAFAGADLTEPHSGLSAKAWAEIVMRSADPRDVINQPVIDIVNATGANIEKVSCLHGDTPWQLVGDAPYWPENPKNIPAWKIEVRVNIKTFGTYCKTLTATTSDGNSVQGHLYLSPNANKPMTGTNDLTAAVFLVFPPAE